MTARTTTLQGADAGRYYVEDQLGYYVDRGEPPGVWLGAGAALLGLDGDVDEDDFLALVEGLDPRTGRLLGTRHTERTARGYDVTCSAPKSASVLFAVGDDAVREAVLDGHDAAVTAVVDWIERHAHCRYRVNGKVHVFDAGGIVAAAFRQHTSRALDPQLHTHVVIANRVPSPDGRWLALDARTIKRDQQTLSRLYHAGLRAELTGRLGVRWHEPVNGIAEIADVPEDVLAEFSQRTDAIEARIEEKLDRFVENLERQPTPRERWQLEREAVLDTRPAKAEADPVVVDDEWLHRLAARGVDRDQLLARAVGVQRPVPQIAQAAVEQIVDQALSALAEQQSTWRTAEIVRELAAAVPTVTGVAASDLGSWLDGLADAVISGRMIDLSRPAPEQVPRRRDGRPITESAVDRLLTLPEILVQEERLLALAERRLAAGGSDHQVDAGTDLTAPQRSLAEAVAGDRALVLAVGPAGTGKTTGLRPAVEQLRREGRAVFGVAPSAAAAEVLAIDTGVDADTVDKLLVEHSLDRPPDHRYDLPPGATVICDEAAMVPTPRFADLVELAERRGWRLALVGDPLQFAAVGRSGMFGHLVATFGAIELGRVHRFNHRWEREASLRLRRGDSTVVDDYERHGRLHGGTSRQMRTAVVDAWWDATARGETASMMAPTIKAVVALNNEAQRRRIDAGDVDPSVRSVTAGLYVVHAGDVIATRRNDRMLVTDRHLMIKNRDHWTVETVHRDGSVTVDGKTGHVRLPADYVREHVELAYAETSHANQGRTVDRSFLYLDGPTGAAGIYVPMTRGRESNEAFVVLRGEEAPADVITEALSRSWIDQPAIAVRAELAPCQPKGDGRSLAIPLGNNDVRELIERRTRLDRAIGKIDTDLESAQRRLGALARDRASLTREVADCSTRIELARRTLAEHDHLLGRRRRRTEVESARTVLSWLPRHLDDVQQKLADVTVEERAATTALAKATAATRDRPQFAAERTTVDYQLDLDARARGERIASVPSKLIRDRFGPCPVGKGAQAWVQVVGRVAQHRAAFEQDGRDLLGRQPQLLHDDVYAANYWATRAVVERADRVLERQLGIEPPGRSLGLSR